MKPEQILFSAIVILLHSSPMRADAETWEEGMKRWPEDMQRKIDAMPEVPPISDLLSLAVLAGNESDDPAVLEVKKKARERLFQVPGFADRMADHVREEREKWTSGREQSPTSYNRQRSWTLSSMDNLPHPSVVRALGEFLPDIERPGYDNADVDSRISYSSSKSNAILAARALGKLIEKPPVQRTWNNYKIEDVKMWELWYAQVKAGNRTFRFKGDPQEYNLAGPVSSAIEPGPAVRSRKDGGESGPAVPGKKEPAKVSALALAAACVALAGAVWFVLGTKKRRSA